MSFEDSSRKCTIPFLLCSDTESTTSSIPVSTLNKVIIKKMKRVRTKLSREQEDGLIELFKRDHFPSPEDRVDIGQALGLGTKVVKIWFQNRRAKEKKIEFSDKFEAQQTRGKENTLHLTSLDSLVKAALG